MATRAASAELRGFFRGELEGDGNSTLATAQRDLFALRESGPEDEQLAKLDSWILETDELIRAHGEHCTLVEFV